MSFNRPRNNRRPNKRPLHQPWTEQENHAVIEKEPVSELAQAMGVLFKLMETIREKKRKFRVSMRPIFSVNNEATLETVNAQIADGHALLEELDAIILRKEGSNVYTG